MTIEFHPRVLELLASRICHDLVSPVGAIGNGVELMEEMGHEAGKEALGLISSSAKQASYRLKCFRLAYGAAGTDKNIGVKEVKEAFVDWIPGGRLSSAFDVDLGVKFSMPPKGFLKTVLSVLILAEECSRGEGSIAVSAMEGNKGIKVQLASPNAAWRDEGEAAFKGKVAPDDLDARSIHAYLTGKFAAHFGMKVDVASQDGGMTFTVSF